MSDRIDGADDDRGSVVMSHLVKRGIPVLVLALVVIGGVLYWRHIDHSPAHEAPSRTLDPVPVSITTVQRETIPLQVRFLGQTEASQVVELRARVAGYLQERTFVEGDLVEKGQRLFQIDPRPFEVALAEARARLASGEATLARARQQLSRLEDLHSRQGASREELDESRTQERVAAAALELNKAQVAAAELELAYTTIEAPLTGRIGQALKDIGSYVDSGQNGLLAVIQQVDPMYVRYAVTEREILRFNQQMANREITAPSIDQIEIQITLADGSVYPHRGHINFIDVDVDQTTGTSVVRGQVPNPPVNIAPATQPDPAQRFQREGSAAATTPSGLLKPGQFIYASVLGIERVDAIRVPQSAVMQSPSGATVLVVNNEGIAETRPIVLGPWSGVDQWIVEDGLEPGDRLITDRLMTVRPGTPVVEKSVTRP